MKKLLFILIATVFSLSTFAQQGLHLGIVGGPQSTWLFNRQDSDDGNEYRAGVRGFVGATVDYHFTDAVGAGIELLYGMQGQNYESPTGIKYKATVNYFKLPILLNFNSNPNNVVMFLGKVGPSFGFKTSASGQSNPYALLPSDQFKSVNISGVLGLGIGFNIKKMVIVSLGLRLDGGFTNALVDQTGIPGSKVNAYGWSTDHTAPYDGTRGTTWNVAGGLEIGAKYIIPTGKSKTVTKRSTTTKTTTTVTRKK